MSLPIRSRKKVKADRATEQGVAGHAAAMSALGKAAGYRTYGDYTTGATPSKGKAPYQATFNRDNNPNSVKKVK